MAIEPNDVSGIAHLARLAISETEGEALAQDLNGILDFVAQLSTVDTADVLPMAHPLEMVQRLRADVVTESDQRTAFQAIAPETEEGLYLVPRVIE